MEWLFYSVLGYVCVEFWLFGYFSLTFTQFLLVVKKICSNKHTSHWEMPKWSFIVLFSKRLISAVPDYSFTCISIINILYCNKPRYLWGYVRKKGGERQYTGRSERWEEGECCWRWWLYHLFPKYSENIDIKSVYFENKTWEEREIQFSRLPSVEM